MGGCVDGWTTTSSRPREAMHRVPLWCREFCATGHFHPLGRFLMEETRRASRPASFRCRVSETQTRTHAQLGTRQERQRRQIMYAQSVKAGRPIIDTNKLQPLNEMAECTTRKGLVHRLPQTCRNPLS